MDGDNGHSTTPRLWLRGGVRRRLCPHPSLRCGVGYPGGGWVPREGGRSGGSEIRPTGMALPLGFGWGVGYGPGDPPPGCPCFRQRGDSQWIAEEGGWGEEGAGVVRRQSSVCARHGKTGAIPFGTTPVSSSDYYSVQGKPERFIIGAGVVLHILKEAQVPERTDLRGCVRKAHNPRNPRLLSVAFFPPSGLGRPCPGTLHLPPLAFAASDGVL